MDERILRFEAHLARNPGNELARFNLGRTLHEAGRFAEAREHLAAALARKPDWMVAQILLARCDLALGHRSVARAGLEQALRLAVAQNHRDPQQEISDLLQQLGPA